jgi:ribosomal protein L29
MNQKDFKPFKLREKSVEDLTTNVDDLQRELSTLKVNKVTSGVASKVAKIRVIIHSLKNLFLPQLMPYDLPTRNICCGYVLGLWFRPIKNYRLLERLLPEL